MEDKKTKTTGQENHAEHQDCLLHESGAPRVAARRNEALAIAKLDVLHDCHCQKVTKLHNGEVLADKLFSSLKSKKRVLKK